MRYFAPRQNRFNGLWHFTVQEESGISAYGPCADGCPGHKTPQGALEHFAGSLLDKRKQLIRDGNFRPCMICGGTTNQRVRIGRKELSLCQEHQDTKTLLRFFDFESLMRDEMRGQDENKKDSGLLILPP